MKKLLLKEELFMNEYQILLEVVKQTFGNVVWTHKIQEKQADIYNERYEFIETINIVIVSVTACGIISLVFTDQLWVKIGASLLSFITITISVYSKTFNLNNLSMQHKIAANKLIPIRDELLQIIADIHIHNKSVDCIHEHYQDIMDKLNKIYSEMPTTTDGAVKRANNALKINAEFTYSAEEIDSFLPPALKGNIK